MIDPFCQNNEKLPFYPGAKLCQKCLLCDPEVYLELNTSKGPCTNDASTQGGRGVSKFLTIRGGGCVISILTILTGGGGRSKIPKIRLTSFVHGPLGTRSLPCSLCKLFFWWALRLQSSARPPVNFGRNGVLVSLPAPCPL